MVKDLAVDQLHAIETTTRIASCFSLVGTIFTCFTFVYSPVFRKPVNRLIFYASWGNILANVATLMSQSPIRMGPDSHSCQLQAFLIQYLLLADVLWNLAMAINVYMTLFRNFGSQQLKSLEWRYHLMCYGSPFLVALVPLFIRSSERGRIYGPATLWCWVGNDWKYLRIALLYGPAWCCIIIAFCIYVVAGREIFAKRTQLRVFNNPDPLVIAVENPFTDFKTTEIHITSELATLNTPDISNVFLAPKEKLTRPSPSRSPSSKAYDQYSVLINSRPLSPRSEMPPRTPRPATMTQRSNRAALDANTAAFGYTKVALLFFVSLLVTWVPSSMNRVYSLIHPDLISLPFIYASGVVLPLMGFWNSVIYITTSWHAVRLLLTGKLAYNASERPSIIPARPIMGSRRRTGSEGESVKGLAIGSGSGYNQA